jgi:hypothetical protein
MSFESGFVRDIDEALVLDRGLTEDSRELF